MTGGTQNEFFLGQQPIVGRKRELVAYELLFRSSRVDRTLVIDDVYATASVIKNAFSGLGIDTALGKRMGFINFDERLLMSDVIEAMPKNRVVLEILEHVPMTPRVVDRCQLLRTAGYTLALDDVVRLTDGLKAVMPYISFVKVDVSVLKEPQITSLVHELKGYGVKLLAEKVETAEQFEFCHAMAFDLFQGYFLARPTIITGKSVQPSTLQLLKIFRLIDTNAETGELEKALRQAPDLTVRLLRVANSVAMQRPHKIYSLQNAILVLGQKQIARIVQIMLFAQQWDADLNTDPLVQTAAVRGRLMEEIADSLGLSKVRDRAFLVGVLSLADSLFGQSLFDILDILNLDTALHEALLHRRGHLGALLNLVEASENADSRTFISVARELGLSDMDDFNRWQVDALRWAGSL
ncbi:EAL and HDOD domain-containing protein [Acidisoma sp.]|uniref:EAL and HDOD domain-containing protein n=1 Tax=Acidisoma sp. TaxID=1872115 RepID=UPI003B001ABA